MRKAKRALSFALAMVVAFGAVTYKPPKAQAVIPEVVGTSALATSTLAAYMTATGIPLTVVSGGAAATSAATGAMLSGYAAATGGTYTVVTTAIASGVTIGTGGVILISAAAAAILAAAVAWAIDEYGLVVGAEPVETFTRDGWYVDGAAFELMSYKNWKVAQSFEPNREYTCSNGNVFCFRNANDGTTGLYLNGEKWFGWPYNSDTIGYTLTTSDSLTSTAPSIIVNTFSGTVEERTKLYGQGIGYDYNFNVLFGDKLGDKVALSLDPDYQALPELAPLEQLEITPVLDPTISPEAVPDAIMQLAGSNTLSVPEPVIIPEPVPEPEPDPDPDPNPDDIPVVDDASGLFGWLKQILEAIKALPAQIAEAIRRLFVPSDEYIAIVPERIASTFDDRTGFLTYPTSVLYDFCDMVGDPAGDFILEWPNVYEPYSAEKLISAGQFNVSKFVRDDIWLSAIYDMYQLVPSAYMVFWFLGLCRRKYNSVVGDRLEG